MLHAILLAFILTIIQSGGGTIRGSVFDLTYREPIPGASVQLLDTETRTVLWLAVTDRNGNFKFENIKPDHYFINSSIPGFYDQVATASVEEGETTDIGELRHRIYSYTDSYFTYRGIQVYKSDGTPLMEPRDKTAIDAHLSSLHGIPIMSVCEYLEFRKKKPLYYKDPGVIVIGILEQTEQGSWLKQKCSNSLKSGDFIWPDAIMLKELEGPRGPFIRDFDWHNEYVPQLIRPFFNDMKLPDYSEQWVAVFGSLVTREDLVAAPCGEEQICGFGYGPISAPAQLNYRYIHYFDNPQK